MIWFGIVIAVIVCFGLQPSSQDEFFSSVHKMSGILDFEVDILHTMQKFVGKNENKLNFLKERLTEYEREREESLATGPIFFENPVNKYLLTKRLTTDWERLENIMQYKEGEKLLKKVDKHLLDDNELNGAIDGFLRIQDVYRLNTTDMAKGLLKDVQYEYHLESRHCYDIGKRASEAGFKKLAHSWFSEGLKRCPRETTEEKVEFQLAIADAKYKLGDIQGANQTYADLVKFYPDSEKVAKLYSEFSKDSDGKETVDIDYSIEHEPIPENIFAAPRSHLFKYACSGILKKTPAEERPLQCGYLVETHPFLWLAPIKVEELNHEPLLVVFHDVISDKEIETIRQITDSIRRATVMGVNGSIVSPVRTSQFQFIPAAHHPVLQRIDQRVEDMTMLNMRYSEQHQFANYGIGGHYSEHHDWFGDIHMLNQTIAYQQMGNRIATVLFYVKYLLLSDVEQGGGTAFPYMQSVMMPRKGSAAFWYNLYASGFPDQRNLHGACPIIVGSKWVQNRWIREHDQSDRRPCFTYNDST